MPETHPRWGRPLDRYIGSYGISSAKERDILAPGVIIDADDAISKICQLGGRDDVVNQSNEADEITVSTLESALRLAQSPETFRHFACPPLISGCIKLMAMVKQSGTPSPFSYEYGYLCFRILTIALGVCILERSNNLDVTIDDMVSESDNELLLVLSRHVSRVIEHEILEANAGRGCDQLLGWVALELHPQQQILVLRSDISTLLDVLWVDRMKFLNAFRSTYSPGLSAVMFLLWRYLHFERLLKENPSPELLVVPFCEIFWRYLLVATTDQHTPLMYMNNDVGEMSKLWDNRSKVADLEDSRTILQAYTDRLLLTDSRFYAPLPGAIIPLLLRFATPFVLPGSEDLLPSLFGSILGRLWEILVGPELEGEYDPEFPFFQTVGDTIYFFGNMFKILRRTLASHQYVVTSILSALIENRFLDLIGRVLLLMKPTVGLDKNDRFIGDTESMFAELAKVAPRQLLQENFQDYLLDWLKYWRHLTVFAECTTYGSVPHLVHFRKCREFWHAIAGSLGLHSAIQRSQASLPHCAYTRCAAPVFLGGAQFACSQCAVVSYCSSQCQSLDWMVGGWRRPHRESCRGG